MQRKPHYRHSITILSLSTLSIIRSYSEVYCNVPERSDVSLRQRTLLVCPAVTFSTEPGTKDIRYRGVPKHVFSEWRMIGSRRQSPLYIPDIRHNFAVWVRVWPMVLPLRGFRNRFVCYGRNICLRIAQARECIYIDT